MTQWVKWLYVLTLAVWIGSIVLFSFAVAPTVFKTLKPEDAAASIRRIFSKYYLIGIVCSAVGIVSVGLLLADRSFGKWPAILDTVVAGGNGWHGPLASSGCHASYEPSARPASCSGEFGKTTGRRIGTGMERPPSSQRADERRGAALRVGVGFSHCIRASGLIGL